MTNIKYTSNIIVAVRYYCVFVYMFWIKKMDRQFVLKFLILFLMFLNYTCLVYFVQVTLLMYFSGF